MASKTSFLTLFLLLNILFSTLVSARCRRRSGRPGGNGDWQGGLGRPGGNGDWQGGLGDGRRGPGGYPGRGGQRAPGEYGDWQRERGRSRNRVGDKSHGRDIPEKGESTPPIPAPPIGYTPPTPSGGSNTSGASCPREAMKFAICANVLNEVQNVTSGPPPPCCTVLGGLVDLEAAACICTALKSNVLGVNRNIPISLSLILNVCSRQVPTDFQCA